MREKSVSFNLSTHESEINSVSFADHLFKNLSTAENENFLVGVDVRLQSFFNRINNNTTLNFVLRISSDDDIGPVLQWTTDGLICLTAHNDGMSRCDFMQTLE